MAALRGRAVALLVFGLTARVAAVAASRTATVSGVHVSDATTGDFVDIGNLPDELRMTFTVDGDPAATSGSPGSAGMRLVLEVSRVRVHADRGYRALHLDTATLTVSSEKALRHHVTNATHSGPADVDCFFRGSVTAATAAHGKNAGVDGAVALSLCEGRLHAQLYGNLTTASPDPWPGRQRAPWPELIAIELRSDEGGGGYGDLFAVISDGHATEAAAGSGCGAGHADRDQLTDHLGPAHTAADHVVGAHATDQRNRRQRVQSAFCVKTVEVLLFNDESMHARHGDRTEEFSARVINAVISKYETAVWNCRIDIRLVGQLTFRHGLPPGIIQHDCSTPWYPTGLELATPEDDACCLANDPCDPSCPAGARTGCLRVMAPATYAHVTGAGVGCYTPTPRNQSETCEETGASIDTFTLGAVPELVTTSGNDVHLLLGSFSRWVNQNKAELATVFGGRFDMGTFFTNAGFGMGAGIVGLANVGMGCNSVVPSVNYIGTSVTSGANVVAHEMGHNLGLAHAVPPDACGTAAEQDPLVCGTQRGVMGRGTWAPGTTTWTQLTTTRMNGLYSASSPNGIRLAGGTYPTASSSGRLEVYVGDRWGAICAAGFGRSEAAVACRALGMVGGTATSVTRPASADVSTAMMSCRGDEASVADCSMAPATTCLGQDQVAALSCTGVDFSCDGNGWIKSASCDRDAPLVMAMAQGLTNTTGWTLFCDPGGQSVKASNMRQARNALTAAFGVSFAGPNFYGAGLGITDCVQATAALFARFGQVPRVAASNRACIDAWRDVHSRPASPCGDGFLEGSEQCDPGLGSGDLCCRSDCTFAPGCECANTDLCCENGRFLARGTVCRAALQADCDTAETCSGSSSDCPIDAVELAGTSCTPGGSPGMCFHGACILPHSPSNCATRMPTRPTLCSSGRDCGANIIRCNRCDLWCTSPDTSACFSNGYVPPDGTPCAAGKQCYATSRHNGTSLDERGVVECVPSAVLDLPPSTAPPTMSPSAAPSTMPPTSVPTTARPSATPSISPTFSPVVPAQVSSGSVDAGSAAGIAVGIIALVVVVGLAVLYLMSPDIQLRVSRRIAARSSRHATFDNKYVPTEAAVSPVVSPGALVPVPSPPVPSPRRPPARQTPLQSLSLGGSSELTHESVIDDFVEC